MTQTIKKNIAMGLFIALSLSIAFPMEAATIRESAQKKLKDAYATLEKQWRKIKPCITKGTCTKKQIAVFVGAAVIVLGLVYRKRLMLWNIPLTEGPEQLAIFDVAKSVNLLLNAWGGTFPSDLSEAARIEIENAITGINFYVLNDMDYENLKNLPRDKLIDNYMNVRAIVKEQRKGKESQKQQKVPKSREKSQPTKQELESMSNFDLVTGFLFWINLFDNVNTIARMPDIKRKLHEGAQP
jgi:hypothetical protein